MALHLYPALGVVRERNGRQGIILNRHGPALGIVIHRELTPCGTVKGCAPRGCVVRSHKGTSIDGHEVHLTQQAKRILIVRQVHRPADQELSEQSRWGFKSRARGDRGGHSPAGVRAGYLGSNHAVGISDLAFTIHIHNHFG